MQGFGRQWVERPLVSYTGNPDKSELVVEVDELGTSVPGPWIEWVGDIEERRQALEDLIG
jgi:hypothetical protein